MTNFSSGHQAEKQAAKYLEKLNYKVITTNWKNRVCEIDIIAQKGLTIYFVEVKYRENNLQGSGFDYITARKLKQMAFAAEIWVQENEWTQDYCLSAIELSGSDYKVINFVETI